MLPDLDAPSITAGLIDKPKILADLRCSDRTLKRRKAAGLPFIKVGRMELYDPAAVRAWIIGHEHRHNVPQRGRPRKAA